MKKRITVLTMIVFIFLIIFTACTQMDPLGIANGVPEGYVSGVVLDNDWIYYVEGDIVSRMRLDGTGIESVFTLPFVYTEKIQLDPVRQKLYVFNHFNAITNQIYEYNLDGTGEKIIADTTTSDIGDIALDHINGYLYYIWSGGIVRINLDDTTIKDNILNLSLGIPSYVAPDFKGGIYYLYNAGIYKVDTITTSVPLVISPTAPTAASKGLYSDLAGDFLYYYESGVIRKVAISTEVSSVILDTLDDIQRDMVLYNSAGKIFYYDHNYAAMPFTIFSINMDGTGLTTILEINYGTIGINAFDILAK